MYLQLFIEMEAVAAAQIAQLYSIPFISVRIISNNIMNGGLYDLSVAARCQDYVIQLCKKVNERMII